MHSRFLFDLTFSIWSQYWYIVENWIITQNLIYCRATWSQNLTIMIQCELPTVATTLAMAGDIGEEDINIKQFAIATQMKTVTTRAIINPSHTYAATAWDLYVTNNFNLSQMSQHHRAVKARLQRGRRPVWDLAATKSVAARFLDVLKN